MTRISSVFNLLNQVGFAVLFFWGSMTALAQPSDTMWTRVYPGLGEPRKFAKTSDGGFIVAGTYDYPSDAALIKIDSSGNVQWSRIYDTDNWVILYDVIETPSHNYVAAGLRFGHPHHFDFASYLICCNSFGDTIWTREINVNENHDQIGSLTFLSDGLLCVGQVDYVGSSSNSGDILIMKLSYDGDTLFTRRFGTELPDRAYDVIQMPEDRFLVTGASGEGGTPSNGPISAFGLLLNDLGDSLWMREYSIDTYTTGLDAERDSETGFLIAGYVRSTVSGYADVYVVHADSSGNMLWQNRYGGNYTQIGKSIKQCPAGGYVVFGDYGPNNLNSGWSLAFRLTEDGDTSWTAGYTGQWDCAGMGGVVMPDSGFVMLAIQLAPSPEPSGLMLIRTYPEGHASNSQEPFPGSLSELSVYPNPFNASSTLHLEFPLNTRIAELTIRNVLGQELEHQTLQVLTPELNYRISAHHWPSGIYFAEVRANNLTQTAKLVLLK